jgi:SAM-dependent methyltransferase
MVYTAEAFRREDESDDALFYSVERLVEHLDAEALGWVERLIGSLVTERRPRVLDLMASCSSHLPAGMEPRHVAGLGLNRTELESNPVLDAVVVHDLNADPRLPFADASFDVVLNTVSVDYMIRPFEVFAEVARVLAPGGLFLVTFSNRMFPPKAVAIWRQASEAERVWIVEDFFAATRDFESSEAFAVQGRPRPADDRHAGGGLPSDPVFAVWAEKRGGDPGRPRRTPPRLDVELPFDEDELRERKAAVGETLRCPYCDHRLRRWAVPQTPFTEWDQEEMRVCFNDRCAFLIRGWDAMSAQGNLGFSHRFMYNPGAGVCTSIPVPSLGALRESIIEDADVAPG